jgi:hypothetical protein
VIPLGLESGWAVAGGLIPIIGLGAIALIIWRAVRDNPSDQDHDDDGEPPDPGDG